MASARFTQLKKRLTELRRTFLPIAFAPTGSYPAEQVDKTRAYRLLCHAEVEAYLEDISLATVIKACDRWGASRRVSRTLIALITYSGTAPARMLDVESNSLRTQREIDTAVQGAKEQFSRLAKVTNHGIRAADVRRLLFPAGVGEYDFDPLWLIEIDRFGVNRGETAHTAARAATVAIPDPQTEYQTITTILSGLERMDRRLAKLRQ